MTPLGPLLLLVPTTIAAQAPPVLRLPEGPRPLRQSIELRIDPAKDPFEGSTEIEVVLPSATTLLWLNASGLEVSEAGFTFGGTKGRARARVEPPDFVGLVFPRAIGPGQARLRVSFHGVISRRNAYGIFQKEAAGVPYVFSQFEAIGARRVFPCFDEPQHKIPFQVTLVVPRGQEALSNTSPASVAEDEGGQKRVVFRETKPLPSYLMAFAVGPFEYVDGGLIGATPFRVVVPKGRGREAGWARDVTPKVLTLLEQYTGSPYPFEKLDEVAVPGLDFAMEHPGLVTYPEAMVVQPVGHELKALQRDFLETAAHELAHQWFGDLVTMAWWDDLWLNESFANWLGTKITHRLEPGWDTPVDQVITRSHVLREDSLRSARAIRQPIASDDDIENAFDDITYDKGEVVLEMFESWLGEDVFRNGARAYLAAHRFGSARSEDFVRALSGAVGRDLGAPFAGFLDQTGAPLLTFQVRCAGEPRITLEQRPYLPLGSGSDPGKVWQVPICVGGPWGEKGACVLLDRASSEFALGGTCPEWVYPNRGGLGYYRVFMGKDETIRALGSLPQPERVAIVSDLEALVEGGELPAGDALELGVKTLQDPEPQVVLAGARLLHRLDDSIPPSLRPGYARLVDRLLGPRARALGWKSVPGEDARTATERMAILPIACESGGDASLGEQAAALLQKWFDEPTAVEPDLLSRVLEVGSLYADPAFFARVEARLLVTPDRGQRGPLVQILGSAGDPAIASSAVDLALDPRIDSEGAAALLTAAMGHRQTAAAVFATLKDRYDALVAKLPQEFGANLPKVGSPFCTPVERDEMKAFFGPRVARSPGAPRILDQVLETIDLCVAREKAEAASLAGVLGSP
jgi:alanyl aminopeptidase